MKTTPFIRSVHYREGERTYMVMPIGQLLVEHRLIERMIALMESQIQRIDDTGQVDVHFIDTAVDFIRTYADACHHGKEEDILFRDLHEKDLDPRDARIMNELIEEHAWARETTGKLVDARTRYAQGEGEAVDEIIEIMKSLVEFYPRHIEKEDRGFFKASMAYFTQEEQDGMLDEEHEFDRIFIHGMYEKAVETLESEL